MASFVVFNGITKYLPGGLTSINADALNPVRPGINSIVALVGEAEGGKPGDIIALDDSARVRSTFRSGDLADAVNLAFAPSTDPFIPGGASRVLCIKTNASTQSTLHVPGAPAAVLVSSAATGGTGSTLVDSTRVGQSFADQYKDCWVVLRPNLATQEIAKVTGYNATDGTFSFGVAFASTPVALDKFLVLAPTSHAVAEVSGGTTTTIQLQAVTFATNEHRDRWVRVYPVSGLPFIRKITANTSGTLTVSPAMPQALAAGTSWAEILPTAMVLKSQDYGVHTNGILVDVATAGAGSKVATVSFDGVDEISPVIGNFPVLQVLFRGAPAVATQTTAADCTASIIKVTPGGMTVNAHVGRQLVVDGEHTTIVSNTAGDITVSPALSVAPAAGSYVEIRNITRARATISGNNGVATQLDVKTGISGADLAVTFTTGMTVSQLVNIINQNPSYVAVVPNNVNGDTMLCADFDFGANTEINALVSPGLTTVGFKQDTMQMVNYFNQLSQRVVATRASGGLFDGALTAGDIAEPLQMSGAVRGISTNASFQAAFDKLLKVRVNHVVPLIDRNMAELGYSSTATVASVGAQLRDHVIACRSVVNSERAGYMGFSGTKAQTLAFAAAINDTDVHVCAQNPTVFDIAGNLREMGPRMMAALAAGCRAGVSSVGEPLTNKTIKLASFTNHSSWDASDLTDANDMIKGGILFAVKDDANIIRWCRDLTTYITDNNLAFSEDSIRDVVRYVAYNLRRSLEVRYTGRKAAPATINNIKNTAVVFLEQCRTESIIVDSIDPTSGQKVKAYYGLKITSSGDVVRLCVGIFPVPGINFILNEISLGLAIQSA